MTDQPHAADPANPPYGAPASFAPPVDAPEPVTTVDGELLDPAPHAEDLHTEADGAVDEVIEGEAVEDELDADEGQGDAAADDQSVDQEADGSAGESGDVLVLETWQIQLPATGDATVDAALARLTEVEGLPPSEHADVYEAVHAGLHEALADLDRS